MVQSQLLLAGRDQRWRWLRAGRIVRLAAWIFRRSGHFVTLGPSHVISGEWASNSSCHYRDYNLPSDDKRHYFTANPLRLSERIPSPKVPPISFEPQFIII